MVRRLDEQLHVNVPHPFRCPISMDVMRSPVSLSTGVTYDRSSIQLWLDSGHNTCPATMQVLPSKDFVPNLNLRRLINLWAQSHGPISPSSSPTLSDHQLRGLVRYLADENEKFNQHLLNSLSKMVTFAKAKDDNRRFLANFNGFVSSVAGVLDRQGVEVEVLELVVRLLDSISSQNGVVEQLQQLVIRTNRNCLSSIQLVLQSGSLSSKIESARILDSIAVDADSKRLIAEKEGLLAVLTRLWSSETDQALHDVILSCLVSLSVTRSIKCELLRFGLVQLITDTLSNRDVSGSLAEKAMKLLSKIATCAEGRSEISGEGRCVAAVAERLMKGSRVATEDGVTVLWSVCCMLGDKGARECVRRSNGVAKILLVMQSGYCEGHSVRRMCGDLMKVLSVGLGMGLSYDTMTKHIMPC